MEHPRGIANAARIHGHIDDLLLDVGCLACVAIFQEKCAPTPFEALPTAIPLLALPRHAMAHNIRALTVGAVKYLKNHESTLVCWSFSASRPRIEDSRSTPLKHLPPGSVCYGRGGPGQDHPGGGVCGAAWRLWSPGDLARAVRG